MKIKIILIIILCMTYMNIKGQEKNEREYRIDAHEIPISEENILARIPPKAKRIKYYREFDEEEDGYEIKFKLKGHWYSVELTDKGELQDVEVIIELEETEKEIEANIISFFKTNYDNYKILKVQRQYLVETFSTTESCLNASFNRIVTTKNNYELIVGAKDEFWELYEFNFNSNGELLEKRKLKSTSYEHLLY